MQQEFESETFKCSWLDGVKSLEFLTPELPFVAVFAELEDLESIGSHKGIAVRTIYIPRRLPPRKPENFRVFPTTLKFFLIISQYNVMSVY